MLRVIKNDAKSWVAILLLILMFCGSGDLLADDFFDELPRIPPTEPADALKSFQVADGYKIELVASEPLIGSPVAIEWDARGRMFVCEMRGYSENENDKISTIGLLTDIDDDGVYDQRTDFATGLRWPTAIFPFDGGLFVGDAPHVYYFKDTDDDGIADQQQTVLTGFGTSNVQGLMNSMRWGLDNKIHIACSSVGGIIKRFGSDDDGVNVRGRDIAFDPRTFEFTPTSGAAQHGMCFDDWGRKFTCSNSDHLQQVMYEDHYAARDRSVLAPPAKVSIADDGPQAEVFRISPVEPWRIVRTRLRVAGTVRGPIEGGGRAAGYFTGATGATIYRGDAWPNQDKGLAIIGDVGSNLIHRKRLVPKGLEFSGQRIDEKSEFVASTDIWFRPAQFANAPDGSCHVVDVCREVIEHPKSLPREIKQHLDLTAGRDRGRIYRIVPTGFQRRSNPNLAAAKTADLVRLLEHPNAWHRETASRLIFERNDASAAVPLRQLVLDTEQPIARMHAIYALQGLGVLDLSTDTDIFLHGFSDPHPMVRQHTIRVAQQCGFAGELAESFDVLSNDVSLDVRYQVTFAAAELENPLRNKVLTKIARRDIDDVWVRFALQISIGGSSAEVFDRLIRDPKFRSPGARLFLADLATRIRNRNNKSEILTAISGILSISDIDTTFALPIIGALVGDRQSGVIAEMSSVGELASLNQAIDKLIATAIEAATNDQLPLAKRVAAIELLQHGSLDATAGSLALLLDNHQPDGIQRAALKSLDQSTDARVATMVLDAWLGLTPSLRSLANEILFARPERTMVLFDAISDRKFLLENLSPTRISQLSKSKNKEIAWRAAKFLKSFDLQPRNLVVEAYRDVLQMHGDVDQGRFHVKKHCVTCHKVEGVGIELGPNLAAMKSRGAEAILVNLLDPNREVNPQYLNYVAVLHDGRIIAGMITSENANSITFSGQQGNTTTVLRSDIEEFRSARVSLMPEGFELQLTKQAMADVIAYLMEVK